MKIYTLSELRSGNHNVLLSNLAATDQKWTLTTGGEITPFSTDYAFDISRIQDLLKGLNHDEWIKFKEAFYSLFTSDDPILSTTTDLLVTFCMARKLIQLSGEQGKAHPSSNGGGSIYGHTII